MDFLWRSFVFGFRLPLMFYLCLSWTLFETCVWIWNLVCNVWWTMLVCATLIYFCSSCGCEVVLTMLKFISYISCILYASISTCRESSVKNFKYIYVCSWYSCKFICTYQGGVLSTHRTWWIYSYHILKFSWKWVSSSKVQFQVHLMPSV